MPQGRVIDPVGQQSQEYDFGYFRRKDEKHWPGEPNKKKVIPFLNRKPDGGRIFTKTGDDVDFEPTEAVVYLEKVNGEVLKKPKRLGTIGIAVISE